jgi:phosphatidylglycerol---prolipoprotein diacylglyceryl transferase
MNYWQNIYSKFDIVAFKIGDISVHWYGILYALALIAAILIAKWIIKKDKIKISQTRFDSYIWWVEIGVILGARIGYIIFYDPNTIYYLTNPWQIFNPYVNGVYTGISGMSYHGALIGFTISTILFCRKYKISPWFLSDISVIGISGAYFLGRIGNFINQELVGRVTDVPWGIYVNGVLRHPSQLYEAFLEGILIFIILYLYRKRKRFNGELTIIYSILYSIARLVSEIYRQPDIQIGFLYKDFVTMGMLISGIFAIISIYIYVLLYKKYKN